MLFPEQQEDVAFIENRLLNKGGGGVLLTNGTGTGKTYSGLGVVKRLFDSGRKNILIVSPTEDINRQWQETAKKDFKLNIHMLENITDNGEDNQISITTYANFQQNKELIHRKWDAVIADESHNLMQNAQGKKSGGLEMLRSITLHPREWYNRWKLLNRTKKIRGYEKEIEELQKQITTAKKNKDMGKIDELNLQIKLLKEKIYDEYQEMDDKWKSLKSELEKINPEDRPKVVFLSATPFAYDKDVDYAEGYLFNYDKSGNGLSGFEDFMVKNFGYRIRYHKLIRPEATVDNRVMEVAFYDKLVNSGVLRGRQINIDKDYDRGFILVDSGIGKKIDDGFTWLSEQRKKYPRLYDFLDSNFDRRKRRYLLESIKARAAVPIARKYIAQGKKVVIFHQAMTEKENNEPFKIDVNLVKKLAREGKIVDPAELMRQYNDFAQERPDLVGLNLANLPSPMETFKKSFGEDALYIDGSAEHKKGRKQAIKLFTDDNSGKNIIICQQDAANAGISLHDTTGKYPRVLINIALPERPSYAMQIEGRIYRVGNASNAVFRYLATGMNLENQLFARTIGGRAETVENLALGNAARGLRESFTNLYMETLTGDWKRRNPGHAEEGTGGKELDSSARVELTEWERAKSFYFGQAKKNAKTKEQEGVDYFATPEPVGLKMVEWLGVQAGERVLEPSAGHGAISRWFSPNTQNTIVEPSSYLLPLAQMGYSECKSCE